MSGTLEELYERSIRPLPAGQRLRLATLILNDIPPHSVGEYRDDWSEEDTRDATLHSLRRASSSFGEDPDA